MAKKVVKKQTPKAPKFENSLKDALVNYWVDFFGWGRATRAEYWWVVLFYNIIGSAVLTPIVGILWSLATLIPGFTLGARRLHDTGRSNWNILWCFLPIIGWIILLVYLCQPGEKKSNKWGAPRI
jgi:uncharacterized membrane protein YhaH (DUF805 family)